jgi:hypothetical protein
MALSGAATDTSEMMWKESRGRPTITDTYKAVLYIYSLYVYRYILILITLVVSNRNQREH